MLPGVKLGSAYPSGFGNLRIACYASTYLHHGSVLGRTPPSASMDSTDPTWGKMPRQQRGECIGYFDCPCPDSEPLSPCHPGRTWTFDARPEGLQSPADQASPVFS